MTLISIRKSPTKYVHNTFTSPEGYTFTIDGNSKVTAGNGTFAKPVPNSISLRHVEDCPNATPTCISTCYVHGLKQAKPELWDHYAANATELRRLLDAPMDVVLSVARDLAHWIEDNAPGGFRWHISGDIISPMHAAFIGIVANYTLTPGPMWIYTRSFDYARSPTLFQAVRSGRIAVNLSADVDNYTQALFTRMWSGDRYRICYLTLDGAVPADLPEGSVIFPDYGLRGDTVWWDGLTQEQQRMVCSPDYFGQSETQRCGICKKCF